APSSSRRWLAICAARPGADQVSRPVRMSVAPAFASSWKPFSPLGAFRPSGGGFDRQIGNTLRLPIRRTPVAPSIVTLVMRPPWAAGPWAPSPGDPRCELASSLAAGRQLDDDLVPALAVRVEPHRLDLGQRRPREVGAVRRLRGRLLDDLELLGDGRRLRERRRLHQSDPAGVRPGDRVDLVQLPLLV